MLTRIISKKQKQDIAEEITSVSMIMRNVIHQFKVKHYHANDMNFEYLQSYTEFRYMQIISSLNKLVH
jgi:hypothetical protein